MTSVEDLEKVLNETHPPKPLLKYLSGSVATPLYLFEAVIKLNDGKFHGLVRIFKDQVFFLNAINFSLSLWMKCMQ